MSQLPTSETPQPSETPQSSETLQRQRPVAVIGAGTLGARIALMFSAGGSPVTIVNRSHARGVAAKQFIDEKSAAVRADLGLNAAESGEVRVVETIPEGVANAWLVIESIAEDIDLKRQIVHQLDREAAPDAVLATNSSSYPSSQLVEAVENPSRLLNIHFLMPPQIRVVELMSCGHTDPETISFLMGELPAFGLLPFRVQQESVGFIFNRVWAAIKREALMVVEEGVTSPDELDRIWMATIGQPPGPFRLMDQVGLDVVLAIENHYEELRPGIPEGPRRLLREYLARGTLGVKSGSGFYDDYAH